MTGGCPRPTVERWRPRSSSRTTRPRAPGGWRSSAAVCSWRSSPAGTALRATLPPPPLDVRVADLAGSALDGESFVRLHLQLQGSGVDALGDARLTYGGTSGRGLHPASFDGSDRMTVQVDLTPDCALAGASAPASLDLEVRDAEGRDRLLRVGVPDGTPLERLVRYRCRTA